MTSPKNSTKHPMKTKYQFFTSSPQKPEEVRTLHKLFSEDNFTQIPKSNNISQENRRTIFFMNMDKTRQQKQTDWKGKNKTIFTDDTILHIENPKEFS